jgi:cytochrome c-type biogenesis protein CcmH/NrfF
MVSRNLSSSEISHRMLFCVYQLVLEGGSHTPIATFHKAKRGFFSSKSRLAFLDITPQGVHIVNDIVTTFIWFEQKRREARRQAAAASAGASAGASG